MVCRIALCARHASSSVLSSFARAPSLLRAAPQKSTNASTSASSTGASPRSAAASEAARSTSCFQGVGVGRGLPAARLSDCPWQRREASGAPQVCKAAVRACRWGGSAHWMSRSHAPSLSRYHLDLSLCLFLWAHGGSDGVRVRVRRPQLGDCFASLSGRAL